MNEADPMPDAHLKVGERLARAREAKGIELEDIAERTRVPLRHLQAIETSDHQGLPATTYSAGFVKTYARLLGLDGEALSNEFRAELGERSGFQMEYTPFEPADLSRVPPRLLAGIALGAAILFGLLYAIFRGSGASDQERQLAAGTAPEEKPSVVAPSRDPVVPSTAVAPAPPSETDVVTLTATDAVWLKISEKDGPTLFMGQMEPGQTYTVPAMAKDPRILTGRPQALRATVGARVIPALGTAKHSISDVSLKGPALIARFEANPLPAEAATAGVPPPAAPAGISANDRPGNAGSDEGDGNLVSPPSD
jgi:transcriptional regulator with XRE-family HTH domain